MSRPYFTKTEAPPTNAQDEGRIALFALGFFVLLAAILYVVITASTIHLQRNELQTLADQLALGAAQQVSAQALLGVTEGGFATQFPQTTADLELSQCQEFVERNLRNLPAATLQKFPDLTAKTNVSADTVTISMQAYSKLPLLPPALTKVVYPTQMHVTSSAHGKLR